MKNSHQILIFMEAVLYFVLEQDNEEQERKRSQEKKSHTFKINTSTLKKYSTHKRKLWLQVLFIHLKNRKQKTQQQQQRKHHHNHHKLDHIKLEICKHQLQFCKTPEFPPISRNADF